MRVLIFALTLTLGACSTERIVEKPVPYPVPVTVYVPVPVELTRRVDKTPKAVEPPTYGEIFIQWQKDRNRLDRANDKLDAIRELSEKAVP